MPMMRSSLLQRFARTRTNPAFYLDDLRLALGHDPERLQRALTEPASNDLLTWNVFASLETHGDPAWLAHRLEALGGPGVRAPARISLWTGRHREPLLRPTPQYAALVRERARAAGGDDDSVRAFLEPTEVPVRVETPDVLMLVDTVIGSHPRGVAGRDRLLELIDNGLAHARRLDRQLAVGVVYAAGSRAASELSRRLRSLRDPAHLAGELAHRPGPLPPVELHELSWQRLLQIWREEADYLDLGGEPTRAFLDYADTALG